VGVLLSYLWACWGDNQANQAKRETVCLHAHANMLSAEEAQARREAEEEALALGLPQAKGAGLTANFTNDAALRLKLEQLTGGVDTDADTTAWVETLTVTAQRLPVLDAQDDLKRDLAFYNQTLSAIRDVAAPRLRRCGVQYLADESQAGPLVPRFERDEPAKKRGKKKEPKEKGDPMRVGWVSAADIEAALDNQSGPAEVPLSKKEKERAKKGKGKGKGGKSGKGGKGNKGGGGKGGGGKGGGGDQGGGEGGGGDMEGGGGRGKGKGKGGGRGGAAGKLGGIQKKARPGKDARKKR